MNWTGVKNPVTIDCTNPLFLSQKHDKNKQWNEQLTCCCLGSSSYLGCVHESLCVCLSGAGGGEANFVSSAAVHSLSLYVVSVVVVVDLVLLLFLLLLLYYYYYFGFFVVVVFCFVLFCLFCFFFPFGCCSSSQVKSDFFSSSFSSSSVFFFFQSQVSFFNSDLKSKHQKWPTSTRTIFDSSSKSKALPLLRAFSSPPTL